MPMTQMHNGKEKTKPKSSMHALYDFYVLIEIFLAEDETTKTTSGIAKIKGERRIQTFHSRSVRNKEFVKAVGGVKSRWPSTAREIGHQDSRYVASMLIALDAKNPELDEDAKNVT